MGTAIYQYLDRVWDFGDWECMTDIKIERKNQYTIRHFGVRVAILNDLKVLFLTIVLPHMQIYL